MTTATPKLDARQQRRFDAIERNIAIMTAPAFVQTLVDAAHTRGGLALSTVARSARLDAAGFALGEELRKISAFTVKYVEQELKCKAFIPEVPDQPSIGDEEYAWNYITHAGKAQRSNTLRGEFGKAIVTREGRNLVSLVNSKGAYDYDDLDLARAALVPGFALPMEYAERCGRMIAEDIDEMMFIGDTGRGILGLLTMTATAGANFNQGAVAALSTLSAADLYEFYRSRINAYLSQFGDARKPNFHILLPFAELMRIKETWAGDNEKWTIHDKLMNVYGGMGLQGFDYDAYCNDNGTGSTQMLCIYPRDGLKVGRVVATEYTEAAPQRAGFVTEVKAYGRVGGVAPRTPTEIHYAYGL